MRCYEIGLHGADMEQLTIGAVLDLLTEKNNDNYPYKQLATQDDFDKF